jgi:hypothetical protein
MHDALADEFPSFEASVKREFRAKTHLLASEGPSLGRPHADTLVGSRHVNMKELRFFAGNGVWRVAFAFDPKRRAILLVAADKSGVSSRRFYKRLIAVADARFDEHLARGDDEG